LPNFIINQTPQPNGDHEVHNTTTGCTYMPLAANQISLGSHLTCRQAVAAAKANWRQSRINGCYYCANACHTS